MSLRISAPSSDEGGRRGRRDIGPEDVSSDYYASRLVKLIPTEAISLFPFLNSRARDVAEKVQLQPGATAQKLVSADGLVLPVSANIVVFAVAWLSLVIVILLRWHATRDDDGRAQWGAVAIAAISFILWVPVMSGSFGLLYTVQSLTQQSWSEPVQKFVPELLLAVWTVLVPVFYRPKG